MFQTSLIKCKYDLNKIQQMAVDIKKNYERNILINENIIDKIIEKTKKNLKLSSKEETLILITGLLQKGGSNKNALNSVKFNYNGNVLSAKEFQNIVHQIKKNMTNRQFARFIADDIAKIGLLLGIEGDLANQIRYEYPSLTKEEIV